MKPKPLKDMTIEELVSHVWESIPSTLTVVQRDNSIKSWRVNLAVQEAIKETIRQALEASFDQGMASERLRVAVIKESEKEPKPKSEGRLYVPPRRQEKQHKNVTG